MRMRVTSTLLVLLLTVVQGVPACAEVVHVSAAASLREVVNELTDRFAREHPQIRFVKNFAGSGILVRQIENGAPADMVIPASREWIDYLRDRRLLDESTIRIFAGNSLVFVGQTGKQVTVLRDVVKLSSIAIGSPKSVPAGEYAMQALRKEGLVERLGKKLVFTRDVREALMYTERGEVDGAFIYRTDAAQAKRVRILFAVPPAFHQPIIYPVALTKQGAGKGAAAAFLQYLQGYEARSLLMRYGFELK